MSLEASTPSVPRISALGAITVSPRQRRLNFVYDLLADNCNYRGPAVVRFLQKLRAALPGPVPILWDRIAIHDCDAVRQYMAGLVAEYVPPYAPKLNPADGAWRYVKYGRLANSTPTDLAELRTTVIAEFDRLRRRADLRGSFIRFTKLPVDLQRQG